VVSRSALFVAVVSGLVLGPGGAPAQEKEGPPPRQPDGAGAQPGSEEPSTGEPKQGGSDKVRKERRPEPKPGNQREGPAIAPPGIDPDAARIEDQVREIQLALLDEIVRVEERLAQVRRRLELELGLPGPPLAPGVPGSRGIARGPGPEGGPSPALPRKQARKALRAAPAPQDLEEERRYRFLLEREREIVEQWNRVGARGPKADGEENAGPERAKLRAELEGVLREILDLREMARERQVERLRRELEDIERALDVREDEKERERLVNSRLRELLEGGARRP
jgi:hypothetical protein